MPTAYLDPASDNGTNQWTTGGGPSPVPTDHYDCVDDGIRYPSTSYDSYLLYASGTGQIGDAEDFGLTTSPGDVDEVTTITARVYGSATDTNNVARIDADIYIAGGWLGAKQVLTGSSQWGSAQWSGSWTKAQIDSAVLRISSEGAGAFPDAYWECQTAYVEIDYSIAGVILEGQASCDSVFSSSANPGQTISGVSFNNCLLSSSCSGDAWTLGNSAQSAVLSSISNSEVELGASIAAEAIFSALSDFNVTLGGISSSSAVFSSAANASSVPYGEVECSTTFDTTANANRFASTQVAANGIFDTTSIPSVTRTASVSVSATFSTDSDSNIIYVVFAEPYDTRRRLSWLTPHEVYLYIDGHLMATTTLGHYDVSKRLEVRESVVASKEAIANPDTPMDHVLITWEECDNAVSYRVYRKESGGAFTLLATTTSLFYVDGPLRDNSYQYKVVAVDDDYDTKESSVETTTISSTPEPPTNLAYSFDAGLKRLTLTWTASTSTDVAGYYIYCSEGPDKLNLMSDPIDNVVSSPWTRDFTTETGTYIFLVHAYDSDGYEEFNLDMLAIEFEDGVPVATLAVPFLRVSLTENRRALLRVTYNPNNEDGAGTPGICDEIRIYWDSGTGAMDWGNPLTTIAAGLPTTRTTYSWTTDVLAPGTYQFAARAATSSGRETSNADTRTITIDSDVPERPVITLEVI